MGAKDADAREFALCDQAESLRAGLTDDAELFRDVKACGSHSSEERVGRLVENYMKFNA